MPQAHYFTQELIDPKYFFRVEGFVNTKRFFLFSAPGLFSSHHFDLGTRILLKYLSLSSISQETIRFLDLGCGYGLVATYIASQYANSEGSKKICIDACDVSPLACALTQHNLERFTAAHIQSHVVQSDVLSHEYFEDKNYDIIVTNPPFSAGKKVVKEFISQGYAHLTPGGVLWIVIPTKKGAKSYLERCRQEFGPGAVTIQALEAGYRVRTVQATQVLS